MAINQIAVPSLQNAQKAYQGVEEQETMSLQELETADDLGGSIANASILKRVLEKYETRTDLQDVRQLRSQLPINQHAPKVLDLVNKNVYSTLIGDTGSGKSTQLPQILLDDQIRAGHGSSCSIICTQPRRIAAISLARRVSAERGERLRRSVGYHVRFDPQLPPPHGSILYCTTGVLLKRLLQCPDEILNHATHLVVDEVHERDLLLDLLLFALKKALVDRASRKLKLPQVVFMSATLNDELFSSYFQDSLPGNESATMNAVPILRVPGRKFPVTHHHLEDIFSVLRSDYNESQVTETLEDSYNYLMKEMSGLSPLDLLAGTRSDKHARKVADNQDVEDVEDTDQETVVPLGLAAATIAHICKTSEDHSAILVFLPGLDEIVKLERQLRERRPLGIDLADSGKFRIFMLHSSISDTQSSVFDPLPEDCRKIILSTNIAETSVTVPDVRYVVDTGKVRDKSYDRRRRSTTLKCTWISDSSVKQRAGRAGRVGPGFYYGLYSRSRPSRLRQDTLPEIVRCDLQQTCLSIKSTTSFNNKSLNELLGQVIEPPPAVAVTTAVEDLKALGALDREEAILPLGRVLALLPVHPSHGKMIVLGIIFRCLSPMIALAAAAGESPFIWSQGGKRMTRRHLRNAFGQDSLSDHLVFLNALEQSTQLVHSWTIRNRRLLDWCIEDYVNHNAMKRVRLVISQIEATLRKEGLVEDMTDDLRSLNTNSSNTDLIRALLVADLSPNIAKRTTKRYWRSSHKESIIPTSSSVNHELTKFRFFTPQYVAFDDLALIPGEGALIMRSNTLVTPMMIFLFGGRFAKDTLLFDHWLKFYVSKSDKSRPSVPDMATLLIFRRHLEQALDTAFSKLRHGQSLTDDPVLVAIGEKMPVIL
ncbi:P-loop containing nucleoside triphosphate hydrolase protein [Xylariaceae sp. FL1272]|nr:P-loop containing nucleoside triphosphate hydrolase protein [Xylariaceae sp. FL1272]